MMLYRYISILVQYHIKKKLKKSSDIVFCKKWECSYPGTGC